MQGPQQGDVWPQLSAAKGIPTRIELQNMLIQHILLCSMRHGVLWLSDNCYQRGASLITKHNHRLLWNTKTLHFFQDRIAKYANTTHPVMFNKT
jgi:hypothetical protein